MTKKDWQNIYQISGAAIEVHNTVGRGLHEAYYQLAMEEELKARNIPYDREIEIPTYYKGIPLRKVYKADFYSQGIIIEFKSVSQVTSDHRAQLFNYMRLTHTMFGMLINFGERSLRNERYLYNPLSDDFILLTQTNHVNYLSD